jgi:hypothetical protein
VVPSPLPGEGGAGGRRKGGAFYCRTIEFNNSTILNKFTRCS